jgi:hypothetical protein
MNNETVLALIVVDGHGSRFDLSLWEDAASLNINVHCIPPLTSGVLIK